MASAEAPAWITLEGRQVLEIRVAHCAQSPAGLAWRDSQKLRELADNHAIDPEQFAVQDDPPYVLVGLREPKRFAPLLAVDDRATAIRCAAPSASTAAAIAWRAGWWARLWPCCWPQGGAVGGQRAADLPERLPCHR